MIESSPLKGVRLVSFLERAKQAAEQARQAAVETTGKASASLRDPATAEKAKRTLHLAKRGLATAVERIDPGVLADVIIKADRKSTRLNSSHIQKSRMPSSA